jgi:hypothetical protein
MTTLLDEILNEVTGNEIDREASSVPRAVKMKNANDIVNVWNLNTTGTPQKIDINSKEFRENYIDNFVRFQVMTPDSTNTNYFFRIYFANGKEKKFNVNDVPIVYNPPKVAGHITVRTYNRPDGYLRDKDGLLYPLLNGKIKWSTRYGFTRKLAGVRLLVDMRQKAFRVMEVAGIFGKIISTVSGLGDIK